MRLVLLVPLALACACSAKPTYSDTAGGGGTGSVQTANSTSTGGTGSSGSSGGSTGSGGTTGDVTPGTGQLTGQLAFPVLAAYEQPMPADGGPLSYAGFHLYGQAVTCAGLPQATGLTEVNGRVFGQVPVVPGIYPIIPGGGVDGGHGRLDVTLGLPDGGALAYKAFSGTITLTSVDGTRVVGSFDVAAGYSDGGAQSQLSGIYDAPFCPGLR